MWYKPTLRAKLIVAFFLIALIPLAVAARVIKLVVTDNYSARIQNESAAVAGKTGQTLEAELDRYAAAAAAIAADGEVAAALSAGSGQPASGRQIYQLLASYLPREERGVQIHLLGVAGGKFSTGQLPNIYNLGAYGDYGIFRTAAGSPGAATVYSNYYTGSGGEKYPLSVAHPVSAGGVLSGYVVIDLPREYILSLLNSHRAPHTSAVALYTGDGMTVIDTANLRREGLKAMPEGQTAQADSLVRTTAAPDTRGLTVVMESSTAEAADLVSRIETLIYGIMAVAAVVAGAVALGITHTVLRPLRGLLGVIERAREGNLGVRFPLPRGASPEFAVLGASYNGMLDQIGELIENVVEKQRRLNMAETQALQAQIKPHFYYNFLNDIKSLAKLGRNDDIVRMVMAFGTLLRANMSTEEEFITVGEEIQLLESYLAIHSIRQEGDVDIRVEVEPELRGLRIPKLLLQPIVENAVIHGMDGVRKGEIDLRAYSRGENLVFEIEDNGPGIADPEAALASEGGGLGLRNVDRRLKLHFGEQYGLRIESTLREKTKVIVTMRKPAPGM